MRLSGVIVCMAFALLALIAGTAAYGFWQDGESSDDPDYRYLDVVPFSEFGDVDAFSGCGELVDYMGETYVRFTGVGEFQTVSGSDVTTYTVGKAEMDLILLTGQSNSYYWSDAQYYDGSSPLPPGTGYYFGTETVTE